MSKVRIYQIDIGPVWSRQVVIFSLLITLTIFLGLPLIESMAKKTKALVVRQVESVEMQKVPPRIPLLIEKKKEHPKPRLNPVRRQLSMMKMNVVLGLQPGVGDFGLNFNLSNVLNADELVFDIAEVDQAPKVVYQVAPVYPLAARNKGIEGKVVIKFIVHADGSVSSIKIQSAAPANLFEQSAINAVKKWRFKPGRRNNNPVATSVELPLEFKLER
ncbi:energy transducer TonB [bacterium]|nr:energy transducer TonB [bacterium]